jgi:integrase
MGAINTRARATRQRVGVVKVPSSISAVTAATLPGSLTTTGKPRQVIISTRLAAILDMQKTAQRVVLELDEAAELPGALHPFGNEIGERVQDFKTAWRGTCTRAGISGLNFHDLRREAGSRMQETPVLTRSWYEISWGTSTSIRPTRIWHRRRCDCARR